jgi:O-antigen/teichoic acid export membrane protein
MTTGHSILKNTSFLMIGTLLQRLISIFTVLFITRYLGPEKYGQLTFVIAFTSMAAVIWDFGLGPLLIRNVSREPQSTAEYTGKFIIIKTLLFIILLPLMFICLKIFSYPPSIYPSVALFAIGTFLASQSTIFEAIYAAWKRMDYSALLSVLRSLLLLIALVILFTMMQSGGILEIIWCYFFSFLGVLFVSLIITKRYFVMPKFNYPRFFELRGIIKEGLPFLLTSMVSIILFKIDHLMLSKMSGDVQLGLYGSAYTLFEIIIAFIPMMVMRSSFPVLAERYKTDMTGMISLYKDILKHFLFLGIPISCGTLLLGEKMILVMYGKEFIGAGILMSILGGAIWIFFLTNLMGWTIVALNKQMLVFYSLLIAMITNILLNIYLIPLYGALGSASATLFCELLQLVFMTSVIKREITASITIIILKVLISSALMSISILFLEKWFVFSEILNLIIIVVSSAFIYFLSSFFLKVYNVYDIKKFMKAW